MGPDGTYGQRTGGEPPVSAPPFLPGARGGVPERPPRPPAPAADGRPFDLAAWLATPRAADVPGLYGFGHRPRRREGGAAAAAVPGRVLLARAALNMAVAWLAFLYGGPLVFDLLNWVLRLDRLPADGLASPYVLVQAALQIAMLAVLVRVFGRMGRWPEVWRRYAAPALARLVTHEPPEAAAPDAPGTPGAYRLDPWEGMRVAGAEAGVARLDEEVRRGAVGDVDYVRIRRAWEGVVADPGRLPAFAQEAAARGAAACAHPSAARDLPRRAEHDLLAGQVRLGTVQDVPKNPADHRGAGFALDPALLGTSLLAVGPAGTGKTGLLVRPVAEALCLQALTGTACAVVVGAADADLGPDAAYDVVVAPGDPDSPYGLDLYGAAPSADEAAARLADALLPDELALRAETARAAVQQVVGPFQAAFGRGPGVQELRDLLLGEPAAWEGLREALRAGGRLEEHRHDLQHRERQHGRADDPGTLLADRLALLDRPAFAGCFNGSGDAPASRPLYAVRALDHPLRVRVKLPEHTHPEAARMLARLVVGQFVQAAAGRRDRSLFAGLVVDDAAAAVDGHTVRGLQRMRGARAGALLALRSLADLPEGLRAPLFGAVGCRAAFPGIAPWDGRLFAEAWGTVWVQEKAVTHAPDTSGGLLRRTARAFRGLLAGAPVQTESVTTRSVERQLWSPSDLAHSLPAGHAVVSLATVEGRQVPPLLVDLRG
ncbi:ATP-binding protein [Streptacidiphilus sp. ASG 303]|uniref:ATP-binding protein n=1 Tax=Streptacidiphilus sp. ASG 303 TaxID=2896847 RepID=UPI001E3AFAE2|nr:ATP-binding protein [Streptacidiphilus sp. ASG 303]MCD0486369.1 ATP-binding protein [Streptacidiphilus sp. ASG 303]